LEEETKENLVRDKSCAVSIRIVKLNQHLSTKKKAFVLSKQILRCGTSIGAHTEESIGGQSRADYVPKMSIAYKEARETCYWLRLLKNTEYLTQAEIRQYLCRCLRIMPTHRRDSEKHPSQFRISMP
jgi:four helix bundle protein